MYAAASVRQWLPDEGIAPNAPSTPPLNDWHYKKGFEIATKHKEAIRQLHWFGGVPICILVLRYKGLEGSSIRKILGYPHVTFRSLPKSRDVG
jgi:hypothetical protein